MGIENYIFIALVYGLGVFLAWRGGFSNGISKGIVITVAEIGEISRKTPKEILGIIIQHRAYKQRKALKS